MVLLFYSSSPTQPFMNSWGGCSRSLKGTDNSMVTRLDPGFAPAFPCPFLNLQLILRVASLSSPLSLLSHCRAAASWIMRLR